MNYLTFNKTGMQITEPQLNNLKIGMSNIKSLHNENNTGNGFTVRLVEQIYKKYLRDKPRNIKIELINDYGYVAYNVLYRHGFRNLYVVFKAYAWKNNKLVTSTLVGERSMVNTAKRLANNYFKEHINILSIEEASQMSFDLKLMNPPYDKNLHLKCLEHELKTAGSNCAVINLSPIRWLQDPLADKKDDSDYLRFKKTIFDKITSLDKVTANEAQENFDIIIGVDLGIYVFDNSIKKTFCKEQVISPVITKIIKKLTSYPVFEQNKKDGWRVRIPVILSGGKSGGRGGQKWYGLGKLGPYYNGMKDGKYWYEFSEAKNQYTKCTPEISNSIAFGEDGISAQNCCDSLKTIFGLYVTYNLITDVNVKPYTIMWLGKDNYKEKWTNERLCKYFDISGFISNTEAEPGSEWEEILNTVKSIPMKDDKGI